MSLDYSKIIGCQENQGPFHSKSDDATKKKIPGCIFAEKLVLENGSGLRVVPFYTRDGLKLQQD